jgi:hypothetical protein
MRIIEKYYPLFLAIVLSFSFYWFEKRIDNIDEIIQKLLDSALAICGALLGFLLTILTLINTIDTRRMRFVKEAGYYHLLIRYLKVALFLDLISISLYFTLPIICSIQALLANRNIIYTVLVFIVSLTWIANIRFSLIFIRLMTDPEKN